MDYVELARDLAHRAHADQVDKAGRPYIEHVARVAAAVAHDPLAESVAWLHDVLEDCPGHVDELWRFPAEITRRVSVLTRIKNHSPELYYARVRNDNITRMVKLADIADNADPARLALLDKATRRRLSRKYAKAKQILEAA